MHPREVPGSVTSLAAGEGDVPPTFSKTGLSHRRRLTRGQIVQIVIRYGIRSGPQGVLLAMRTFAFLHGGVLPAFVAVSVKGMSLIHRVVDLGDRPEFRVAREFLRSHDDYVGVEARHVERFLT